MKTVYCAVVNGSLYKTDFVGVKVVECSMFISSIWF